MKRKNERKQIEKSVLSTKFCDEFICKVSESRLDLTQKTKPHLLIKRL